MNKARLTVAEYLYKCSLMIKNSLNDQLILDAVSVFGYTAEKLETGKIILEDSIALNEAFDKEHGDVSKAFAERNTEKENAHGNFKKHFTIAKVALKNDPSAKTALKLTGRRSNTFSGWLNQTRSFYNNLMTNKEWMAAMAEFGITAEKLSEGLNQVKQVESYAEVIMREKGDAQNATIERDNKLDELSDWINDYEKIAEIALEDNPQLLEKLGIVVKR